MGQVVGRAGWGVVWALGSYLAYALHYATVKALGARFDLNQLIFLRSAVMLALTLGFGGGPIATLGEFLREGGKVATGLRSLCQYLSALLFFLAASAMPLADATTIYSAAPLIVLALSMAFLGERPRALQGAAVVLGLCGTVIAADPSGGMRLVPVASAFGGAVFWALTVVLTRVDGQSSTRVQMVNSALVFMACSGFGMSWRWPATAQDWALLALLGPQIALAQLCFFQACRRAPASLVGPLEYSTLLWATGLGLILFAEIPTARTLCGMALVLVSGLGLIWVPRRRPKRLACAGE